MKGSETIMDNALQDKLVVLMGGSGFLGQYVAQGLLERGARLRIAAAHPEKAFKLKPLANLGQLQFVRCDATSRDSVRRVMRDADAVVNLVGAFDGDLYTLMGEAPGWMAEDAAASGASAFVHVSAIVPDAQVDEDGEVVDPIRYAGAKRMGEERVRSAFPNASIMRPSLLFGQDDEFTNMFARLIRWVPVMPVFGPDAKIQPVFVDDVANAIVAALAAPGRFGGKTFELGGPEVMTMEDFNRRIAAAQERERTFLPMPDEISAFFAKLPGTPMSTDQWRLLKAGSVADPHMPGLADLGVKPRALGLFLDRWMTRYRKQGRFTGVVDA